MKTIAYNNPFVPPEWIAAHGLSPHWMRLECADATRRHGVGRAICPYAAAVIDRLRSGLRSSAVVLTTTCDQMRYAADMVEPTGDVPVFLMNVPSTWQGDAVRQLYVDELKRLGRFLERRGGTAPSRRDLARVMSQYENDRDALRAVQGRLTARQFAQALVRIRGNGRAAHASPPSGLADIPIDANSTSRMDVHVRPEPRETTTPEQLGDFTSGDFCERQPVASETLHPTDVDVHPTLPFCNAGDIAPSPGPSGVPLALVGGPLLEKDYALLDVIQQAGGHVVLDATEGGQRTLPAPFDQLRLRKDPLSELARAYFETIPDVFRRPNDGLYQWLGQEVAARKVRGILLRRYVWCDIWHAEQARMKQWSPVPVLDIEVGDDGDGQGRTAGRIEAFLEMLT